MTASPAEIQNFIASFEERLASAEKASSEAWWDLATSGTEAAQKELVRAGMAYNRLFADRYEYELMKGWYERRSVLESSVLRRQVAILYKTFAGRQGDEETLRHVEELEAEANAIYGKHRGLVGGEEKNENELREILRASEDSALRCEAWEASKSVGRKVEGLVRELARLRNELARAEGYKNHYARSLDLQEIEGVELARIMEGLETATNMPFRNLKRELDTALREKFGIQVVVPWHHANPLLPNCKRQVRLPVRRPPRRCRQVGRTP